MHTVIVLGSPRKNGNSETLAKAVVQGLEEGGSTTEFIRLNTLSIRACQGCGGCDKTGECVIKDDMQEVYEKVDGADRVLLVTPVYFYTVSAQLKLFMDRIQARWSRKYNLNERFRQGEGRRGYLLATSATTGDRIFECSELPVRYTLDALDMEWGEPLLVSGVDHRGDIDKMAEVLQNGVEFGRKIAAGTV